jgi:hypothetical protein
VQAEWMPLFISPIRGSFERLVAGVIVANQSGFHIEMANELGRLHCLYGDGAEAITLAMHVVREQLEQDLARNGIDGLRSGIDIGGFEFGPIRSVEGLSLRQIGQSWMAALSSIYSKSEISDQSSETSSLVENTQLRGLTDRLPVLVMEYVSVQRAGLTNYFNRDVVLQKRQKTSQAYEVSIDFAGSKLVANFGTLRAGGIVGSVNRIKRRLWDLKVDRDKEVNSAFHRSHELIVQRPPANDPQITERQHKDLTEALKGLESQADQEELRLLPMSSVKEIGEHLIKMEARG